MLLSNLSKNAGKPGNQDCADQTRWRDSQPRRPYPSKKTAPDGLDSPRQTAPDGLHFPADVVGRSRWKGCRCVVSGASRLAGRAEGGGVGAVRGEDWIASFSPAGESYVPACRRRCP